MKRLLILLFAFSLFTCQNQFDPDKYVGGWIPNYESEDYSALPYLKLTKDSIYFSDVYDFHSVHKYELKKQSTYIIDGNSTIERSFQFNSKDSTLILNGQKYIFIPNYFENTEPIRYKLIELKLPDKITAKELNRYEKGFHLIKNNNTVSVKINDRLRNYEDIITFVINRSPHFDLFGNVIYLSQKIQLRDIVEAYYSLAVMNQLKVVLITDFDLSTNTYSAHIESIEIWNEQLETYFGITTEKVLFKINSRKAFIKEYNPEVIKIYSKEDFSKLNDILKTKNYIISIDQRLSLKEYFELKESIKRIKKEKKNTIRSESIELLSDS